jgi:predicted DNA-binding transcriptional regulator AlpA
VSEPLLNARELGERLGLAPATVLDRYEAGDLPGFKLYGRHGSAAPVRFRWSEIEAALEGWRNDRAVPAPRSTPVDREPAPQPVRMASARRSRRSTSDQKHTEDD